MDHFDEMSLKNCNSFLPVIFHLTNPFENCSVNVILCSAVMTSWTIQTVSEWPRHIRDRFLWIGTNSILEEFPNLENPLIANWANASWISLNHFIAVLPELVFSDAATTYQIK